MWRTSDRSVLGGIVLLIALALSCGSDKGTEPTIDTTPAAVPSGLTLLRAGNGEIAISWRANSETNLAGYKVYRAEEADSAQYIQVAVVTPPSYTDIGLDYKTMYYYKVTAYNVSGNESERSQEVSARPANIWRPEMPKNLRAVAHNITLTDELDIQVSWSANTETDLQGYNIYRASSSGFTTDSTTFLDSTSVNNYTDPDVAVGQWYYYKVTAFDKGDWESLPTEEVSDIPLKRPVLISPPDAGQVSAKPAFQWQRVEGAQFYQVSVTKSQTSGEIWDQVMSSDSDTTTVYEGTEDLVSGRTYYWKVGTMTNDPGEINSLSEIRSFAVQ